MHKHVNGRSRPLPITAGRPRIVCLCQSPYSHSLPTSLKTYFYKFNIRIVLKLTFLKTVKVQIILGQTYGMPVGGIVIPYYDLFLMWYTGMCSLNGDQTGQWKSISMTSQWPVIMTSQWSVIMTSQWPVIMTSHHVMTLLKMPHCDVTMGNDVARDIHCDVTMSNDATMCTYHSIVMTLLWTSFIM